MVDFRTVTNFEIVSIKMSDQFFLQIKRTTFSNVEQFRIVQWKMNIKHLCFVYVLFFSRTKNADYAKANVHTRLIIHPQKAWEASTRRRTGRGKYSGVVYTSAICRQTCIAIILTHSSLGLLTRLKNLESRFHRRQSCYSTCENKTAKITLDIKRVVTLFITLSHGAVNFDRRNRDVLICCEHKNMR